MIPKGDYVESMLHRQTDRQTDFLTLEKIRNFRISGSVSLFPGFSTIEETICKGIAPEKGGRAFFVVQADGEV